MHPKAMSRIENGRVVPNVLMAIRIAKALKSRPRDLWVEEEGDL
jgi:DNA-binding XRE family transcriptional regulator